MKILSINVRGFGVFGKLGWIKGLCLREKLDIAAFQETKCRKLDDLWVQQLWGNSDFGYIQKEATGNSGGMLVIWDTNRFKVSCAVGGDCFLAIRGNWTGTRHDTALVNVFGPHNDVRKRKMWDTLDNLIGGIDSRWVLCGDFNEVCEHTDRFNYDFHEARARRFNEFIIRNNLIEIPLKGRKFTRISDDGTKFSKLDRFLVSDNFLNESGT
ncbi:uncharacterized protein [Rutidosis leptorrhynchoides]|uniref:uncharacterized protein n=1 Tax=Rutidosis leptorrhynchoides TaxID=125765 RepID=UPI003A99E3EA